MYLRLGNTNIKYNQSIRNDYMIIAQITNSTIGYESPVLVHSEDELSIWFGNDFEGRRWLVELLNTTPDTSLLLASPISTAQQKVEGEDFIDYSKFLEINTWEDWLRSVPGIENYLGLLGDNTSYYFYSSDMLPDPENLCNQILENFKNKLTPDHLEEIKQELLKVFKTSLEGKIFKVKENLETDSSVDYIWTGEFYTPTSLLPQNFNIEGSESFLHRDTLQLGWKPCVKEGENLQSWSYPKYTNDFENKELNPKSITIKITLPEDYENNGWLQLGEVIYYCGEENPNPEFKSIQVKTKTEFLEAIQKDGWVKNELEYTKESYFPLTYKKEWEGLELVVISELDWTKINEEKIDLGLHTLAFDVQWPTTTSYISGYLILGGVKYIIGSREIGIDESGYFNKKVKVNSIEELKTALQENGWIIENNLIYRNSSVSITYLYDWGDLELTPNFNKTQEILSNNSLPGITFWSKTIGRPREEEWEEDNIHLKIEKISDREEEDLWRITISKYDYIEIFEGSLRPSTSRIDHIITRESKLIHARIPDEISTLLKEIPEGEYQLRGAKPLPKSENHKSDMMYTMSWMLMREWYIDYFLIPDVSEFMDNETSKSVYETWLNYSSIYTFQYLIQNKKIKDPETNTYSFPDLKWNYTKDTENRLVWFCGDIIVNRESRPGYYLFLLGPLQDIYSMTAQSLIYYSPVSYPYDTKETDIEKLLKEYKSNYLVCNNQIYYYKEYQNGKSFSTTIWMRFIMGKVNRELRKRMESYLGSHSAGEILEAINGILSIIKERFSIVRSINIQDYTIDWNKQITYLLLNTTISDLKENNMTLDININYNKN